MRISVPSFWGAILVFLSQTTLAEGMDGGGRGTYSILSQSVQSIPEDISQIAHYPWEHQDQTQTALLVVGGLVLLDKPITKFYQLHVETPLSGFALPEVPKMKKLGFGGADGWLVLGIGSTYAGGWLLGDERAQATGLKATKAVAYSVLLTHLVLKTATGRKRPISWSTGQQPDGVYTNDPLQFGYFHKPNIGAAQYGTAMPSFHFTMFFATAKVYQQAYDNYWVPYSLMTVGLVSNIRGHKHWVSDMVAGALVGTAIGSVVGRGVEEDGQTGISPVVTADGMAFQYSAVF